MDVRAKLTVVGDGPVGAVGRALNQNQNTPKEWALGMKFVIELPEDDNAEALVPGTVWHTFGYPEPEIFGFMYVHPNRLVSVGIFVPSWLSDPSRTVYRYLQHFIQHPALWKVLKNGMLRSWGAKSLEESGRRNEPVLTGDGYARIGEGSGSTNMLTGSGVDEAWTTGTELGEAVLELLHAGKPFTHENLAATYEKRRRASRVRAEHARQPRTRATDSMAAHVVEYRPRHDRHGARRTHCAAAFRQGPTFRRPTKQIRPFSALDSADRAPTEMALKLATRGCPLHDALLTARGWPEISFDGRLLITQQDALLIGGKVQAMPGFADHVIFRDLALCVACDEKTCVAMCSGQAITQGPDGLPAFEREKCVHCGGCLWNCTKSPDGVNTNIEFHAGSGGLHSAEN